MKTILLVEDDPFLADIYVTKLEKEGLKVQVVQDGQKVLSEIKESKPDLLLLDIVLPGMDGWEILQKIKECPELESLPIIIFSNLDQKLEVKKGLNLGAVKYLIKANYTPTEIMAEIKKILNNNHKKVDKK